MMRLTAPLIPLPAANSRWNIGAFSISILLVIVDRNESRARREILGTSCVLSLLRSCHLEMIATADCLDRTSN